MTENNVLDVLDSVGCVYQALGKMSVEEAAKYKNAINRFTESMATVFEAVTDTEVQEIAEYLRCPSKDVHGLKKAVLACRKIPF